MKKLVTIQVDFISTYQDNQLVLQEEIVVRSDVLGKEKAAFEVFYYSN